MNCKQYLVVGVRMHWTTLDLSEVEMLSITLSLVRIIQTFNINYLQNYNQVHLGAETYANLAPKWRYRAYKFHIRCFCFIEIVTTKDMSGILIKVPSSIFLSNYLVLWLVDYWLDTDFK